MSPRARPGNWLPTGGVERYILVMRFYDTSARHRDARRPRSADAGDHLVGELRMIRWLLWIVGGLVLGGIVHLASVMWLPRTATQDAYARLVRRRPGQRLHGCARADPRRVDHAVHGPGFRDRSVPL